MQPLTDEEIEQLFSSCGWVSLFAMEIFLVSHACSETKSEARNIGTNLHRYAMECDSLRCKAKVRGFKICISAEFDFMNSYYFPQMKTFSMQLLHKRIDFSPFGLFKLDLGFVYAVRLNLWTTDDVGVDSSIHFSVFQMIGAVCTYLIILIQFDMAQTAQKTLDPLSHNSTAMNRTHHWNEEYLTEKNWSSQASIKSKLFRYYGTSKAVATSEYHSKA